MKTPRRLWFTVVAVVSLLAVLSGCLPATPAIAPAPAGSTVTTGAGTAAPAAAQPAKQRVLTVARAEPTLGLDPAKGGTAASLRAIELLHDPLVDRDRDNKPIPWIAESWTANADSTVWTFTIRKDAKFSNGTPITADDVKFSFDRMGASDLWSARIKLIKSVEVKDANTVVFTMTRSLPEFLDLPGTTVQYSIVSKAACEKECDFSKPGTPVSGPWSLQSYTPKNRMVLVKNPYYWLEGYPKFDRIEYTFNEDATAAVAAVESGTADLYGPVPAKDAARLQSNPSVQVAMNRRVDNFTGFGFDKTKPPFNDKRVRQAVGLALEPPERTKTCWFGIATSLYGGYFYETEAQRYPALVREPWRTPRKDRLAQADKLLAEAGWVDANKDGVRESKGVAGIPDGTKLEATVPYESNWVQAECHTLLLQGWAKDIGLTVKPDRYDPANFWNDVFKGGFNMWHFGFGTSEIPWEKLRIAFRSNGEYNKYAARVSDPQLDAMIDEMLATVDLTKKTDQMSKIVDYVVDQQYIVADGSQDSVQVATKKMINFWILPNHAARSLITADIPGR